MKILFITPSYYNLQTYIEKELEKQGHSVDVIPDNTIDHDNGYKGKSTIKKVIDNIFYNQEKIKEEYWKKTISHYKLKLEDYDILLCINGCSLGKYFFDLLTEKNKKTKKILYLWDTLNFFDYKRNFKFFDRIYTFDFNDSIKNKVVFLPFYWIKGATNEQTQYSVSLIGSCHDGRLWIAVRIARQLDEMGLSYYFKIVCNGKSRMTPALLRKKLISHIQGNEAILLDIKALTGKIKHPFLTPEPISIEDTNRIISMSDCILDTDMECQSGPTPRLIWALAQGKKIITTNKHITDMPFYNEKNICIIDRKNPVIDYNFITSKPDDISSYMEQYRIDNWVKKLIEG